MIAELMARWCATPCSLLFISLGALAVGLALWTAWKCFRRWDQRDPLAIQKLALAIQVVALMMSTSAIAICLILLHQQSEKAKKSESQSWLLSVPPDVSAPTPESRQNPSPGGGDVKAPEPPCDPRNEEPSAEPSSQVPHRWTSDGVESNLLWRGQACENHPSPVGSVALLVAFSVTLLGDTPTRTNPQKAKDQEDWHGELREDHVGQRRHKVCDHNAGHDGQRVYYDLSHVIYSSVSSNSPTNADGDGRREPAPPRQ